MSLLPCLYNLLTLCGRMFEAHMDEYLDEELEMGWLRHVFGVICKGWEKEASLFTILCVRPSPLLLKIDIVSFSALALAAARDASRCVSSCWYVSLNIYIYIYTNNYLLTDYEWPHHLPPLITIYDDEANHERAQMMVYHRLGGCSFCFSVAASHNHYRNGSQPRTCPNDSNKPLFGQVFFLDYIQHGHHHDHLQHYK